MKASFKFKILFYISFLTISTHFLYGQKSVADNDDFKQWTLEQLLFSIDSGLLNPEKQDVYLEYYLQKAKRAHSEEDVVTAYKKKIGLAPSYSLKKSYSDSLYFYGKKRGDSAVVGDAYYYKAYTELVEKKYTKALEYALLSEEYLKKVDNHYTYFKVKNFIGNTYYHLEDYGKAYALFQDAAYYHLHQKEDAYNNKVRYLLNLYSLSKTAYKLQKFDSLSIFIHQGYRKVRDLKAHHQPLEKAYFNLVDGMYHNSLMDYKRSDSLLSLALPHIKKNNDFANEHLVFLFQGKNLWKKGRFADAQLHFSRIDSLYHASNFINKELSEAYLYMIDYNSITNNPKQQLYYTNTLLKITEELQKSNRNLTTYLHTNLDTKSLQDSKEQLERQLQQNGRWTILAYILLVFILAAFVLTYIINRNVQKKLRQDYEQLVLQNTTNSVQDALEIVAIDSTIDKGNATHELTDTHQILLDKLRIFEDTQGYLQKVNLDDLAVRLHTNRTTLSRLLNDQKGGFSTYINKLRITNAITKLSEPSSKLHLLNTEALAEEFGFGNSKSFAMTFKEIAGMSVSDFIRVRKQLL